MGPMTKRLPRVVALLLCAFLALVVASAGARRPAGPAEGGPILPLRPGAQIATTRPSPPTRLRLASFNIHGGRGTHTSINLDGTAAAASGYDLVALQEV